jgi:hypothetical protein
MSKSNKKQTCKQGKASTSVLPTNSFKLGVINNDYKVREEIECQSDFSEALEDTQTAQTPVITI